MEGRDGGERGEGTGCVEVRHEGSEAMECAGGAGGDGDMLLPPLQGLVGVLPRTQGAALGFPMAPLQGLVGMTRW